MSQVAPASQMSAQPPPSQVVLQVEPVAQRWLHCPPSQDKVQSAWAEQV